MSAAAHKPADDVRHHEVRPFGVAISPDALREGDFCDVTVEAQMMGEPTGVFLKFKSVRYQGIIKGRRQFDSEIESHFFAPHEIMRVTLVDEDLD